LAASAWAKTKRKLSAPIYKAFGMPDRSTASILYRAVVFLATAFTIAVFIFLVDKNLVSQSEQFQESDFIMTFYVAGRLISEGRASELYPDPSAKTFVNSPFDKAAHEFLPKLPQNSVGAYMYIPLVAGFFTPFGWLNANVSLLLWQALSVLALLWVPAARRDHRGEEQ
jgi:hypothetical protein